MTSTIPNGSFQSILQDYRTHAAAGAKTHFIKDGGADAGTLKDTLGSLGFRQEKLSDAVRAFQEKHNVDNPHSPITVDGKVGGQTLEALYSSADQRRQMCGADTAKYLDAKASIGPLSSAPTKDSVRLSSLDPSATAAQLEQKLKQNQATKTAAKAETGAREEKKVDVGAKSAEITALRSELAELGNLNPRQPGYHRKQQVSAKLDALATEQPGATKVADLDARIEAFGTPNPRQPEYHQKKRLQEERARLI